MNTRLHRLALLASLAWLLVGCAGFHIKAPDGFATLQNQQPAYDFRAASAYGVALGVHRMPNHEHAPLTFWAEAIDQHVRTGLGYAPLSSDEVRAAHGAVGRRFAYAMGTAAQPTALYEVTVFANAQAVYVVEAGGAATAFARARPAIEQSLRSFEPVN